MRLNSVVQVLSMVFVASHFLSAPAEASRYGTSTEAAELASQLIQTIEANGMTGARDAIHDIAGPYQATGMGVHIFDSSIIVADSRDPDLENVSYAGVADLNGNDFWDTMVSAANGDNVMQTLWYDYDNPSQEYLFTCHSEWQTEGVVMVWICY